MKKLFGLIPLMGLLAMMWLSGCSPEPPLHLYWKDPIIIKLPIIDLNLEVYWDYDLDFGVDYDWRTEWYYAWDEDDRRIFGELGYSVPNEFNIRRYLDPDNTGTPHSSVLKNTVEGTYFQGIYNWGFWDFLVWNQISTLDGVQSLVFDEETTLDSVTAHTNPSMIPSRYNSPRYTRAFYAPEPLFAAYEEDIEINKDLHGFTYDPERDRYVMQLHMLLRPITYIYLTQVILHNNRGRVTAVDGSANLSGMARTTCLNSGRAGADAVTVNYYSRLKRDLPYLPYSITGGEISSPDYAGAERVDIIGGRLMTFGMCNQTPNNYTHYREVTDRNEHYMDVNMQFNNGMDSTLVFNVTDQVRRRYKGGVITVELDMDTVPIPTRRGGSGFNAIIEDFDTVTHVIEFNQPPQ